MYSINEFYTTNKKGGSLAKKKDDLTMNPTQHIVRNKYAANSALQKQQVSSLRIRNPVVLLICIILILITSFFFPSQREMKEHNHFQVPKSLLYLREDLTFSVKRINHLSQDNSDKLLLVCCFSVQLTLHKMLSIAIRWHKMELHQQLKLRFTCNSDRAASSGEPLSVIPQDQNPHCFWPKELFTSNSARTVAVLRLLHAVDQAHQRAFSRIFKFKEFFKDFPLQELSPPQHFHITGKLSRLFPLF